MSYPIKDNTHILYNSFISLSSRMGIAIIQARWHHLLHYQTQMCCFLLLSQVDETQNDSVHFVLILWALGNPFLILKWKGQNV